jgi:hypothetical protein
MAGKTPERASVAHAGEGSKMHAPAAERNASVLCDLLLRHAPRTGRALEIASGTGQHVATFSRALPGLTWQPTDVDPLRLRSIDSWAAESGTKNIEPACHLDACTPGWAKTHGGQDLVVLINLMHLIPQVQAQALVTEAIAALTPQGRFVLYGPFMRNGTFISAGDANFHTHITDSDPALGYKNDLDVEGWLRAAGAGEIIRQEMPANNLAFIASR